MRNTASVPPPPPVANVSVRPLFSLRPGPNRWLFALRAGCAMALSAGLGWLLGDLSTGLVATIGAFTALYGSDRPYRNRAVLLGAVVLGFMACVTVGAFAAAWPTPWPGVVVAAATAAITSFLCSALRVGPPGAYLFALATAASTFMHQAHPLQLAFFTGLGGLIAFELQMMGMLWRPRGPEEQALGTAASAVADFIERSTSDTHDQLRQATASALYESWGTLTARQPGFARPNGKLHRLRTLNRELHRLFGQALVAANAGTTVDRAAAAEAREIARMVRDPPPVAPDDTLYEPLATMSALDVLRASLEWGSVPLRVATRVGLAALIAGSLGALADLERAYWAIAAAVLVLYQGFEWSRAVQRGLERVAGTFAGLVLAWALLAPGPHGLALVAMLAVLQVIIELLVLRNYALATAFITPAALLIASGGHHADSIGHLLAERGIDTLVGCGVGLIVLFVTSRPRTVQLRTALARTLVAAGNVLPYLARTDMTSEAARTARRTLRNSALDLRLLYEEQAGGPPGGRSAAIGFWPAIVAVQRLAFRILAECWQAEAAGAAATAPVSPDDVERLRQSLAALARGHAPAAEVSTGFLRDEIAIVTDGLAAVRRAVGEERVRDL